MINWVNNMKLNKKLSIILLLAALLIIVSNIVLINNLKTTSQQLEKELYDELYYSTFYLLNADRDFYQAEQAFVSFQTIEKTEAFKNDYEHNVQQVKDNMAEAREILLADNGLNHGEVESYFNSFNEYLSMWENATRPFLSLHDEQISIAQIENLKALFESAREQIDLIQQDLESSALSMVEALHQKNQTTVTVSSIITALCVIVVFVLGFLLTRSITKPIERLANVFQQVSEGSLKAEQTEQLNVDRKDEIGQLTAASHKMIHHLREMVQKMQEISQTVSRQSEELTQSADAARSGAEQVASTMEQLSAGAEEQASSSSEISHLIEQLNEQILRSNEDGQALEESSQAVYRMSNEGKEEMTRSVELMNEITALVTESVEKVKDLERRSGEISKLIEVIQDISAQTNLLSLNAAIEAARAGESGRGFAVVAEEVRKLAEQVGDSGSEITQIIEGIQKETESMVASLEAGYQKAEEGNEQIQISRTSFESINQAVLGMSERIQNVTTNLRSIASNAEKVNESASEIAAASEEAAAGIEESAATAEEQSQSMQEIVQSAQSLSRMSDELDEMTKQFKL